MITTLKDHTDGKIVAYCEWRLVGESGQEVPSGRYVWVQDMWCHPSFRSQGKVNRIIDEVMRVVPQADYVYFQRKDVSNKVHIYTKRQMERKRKVYEVK